MKVDKPTLTRWTKYCRLYCNERGTHTNNVRSKITAWNVAFALDIPKEAYHINLNDTHIETALKRIFPNAWGAS